MKLWLSIGSELQHNVCIWYNYLLVPASDWLHGNFGHYILPHYKGSLQTVCISTNCSENVGVFPLFKWLQHARKWLGYIPVHKQLYSNCWLNASLATRGNFDLPDGFILLKLCPRMFLVSVILFLGRSEHTNFHYHVTASCKLPNRWAKHPSI